MSRVLVLSASAGAGHMAAADAVVEELRPRVDQVRHFDTLKYTNQVFQRLYGQAYLDLVNKAPEVLGWLYNALDKPWKHRKRRIAFETLNMRKFMALIERLEPDVCICTHFLPAEIIAQLKRTKKLDLPLGVVITDYGLHAMWLCKRVDRYFAPTEEIAHHLASLGIDERSITVTGIPVKPVFAVCKDRDMLRRTRNLDPDLPTILVSAGGFGVGPVEAVIQALLELPNPAQVVAICGKSSALFDKLQGMAQARAAGPVKLLPVGFTREMDEWMALSDLFVGKPGGLTTSECLARHLPMIVIHPIPGQEERNSDYLLEHGAALRAHDHHTLLYKVRGLLDDPARLAAMRKAAARIARPYAARSVATEAVGMARTER